MGVIIVIIGLFLIIWEDANKNVPSLKQKRKLNELNPLVDKERNLRENFFSGKIFKK